MEGGLWLCCERLTLTAAPRRASPHSPLFRVQIAAAHSNGEEARRAVGGAVAVQEASDIEAEVHGARQVIGVGADPPNDLSDTRAALTWGPGVGATQGGRRQVARGLHAVGSPVPRSLLAWGPCRLPA